MSLSYLGQLHKEFNDAEYGKRMFFPDGYAQREAKFMLWLMRKYGVEDQFLKEVEQHEMLAMLKKV